MNIFVVLIIIFILSFLGIYWLVRTVDNKNESKDSVLTLLSVTFVFSILSTLFFAFVLFVIIGSTSVVNKVFSLSLTTNQLVTIGISIFIYSLTLDNVLEKVFEYLFNKSMLAIVVLTLSRIVSFYIIGFLLKLNETTNITISVGVSLILLVVDGLYYYRDQSKVKE